MLENEVAIVCGAVSMLHGHPTRRGPRRFGQNPGVFEDLQVGNQLYRREFHDPDLGGVAAAGLAVVTCIDSRIDPLAMLGLHRGDAKILRNAGARVTDDVLRSLVLAVNLLAVTRVCVVQHTDCALVGTSDDDLRARIGTPDATDWHFLAMTDPLTALREDLERIRACPLLPEGLAVAGFCLEMRSGELVPTIV